MALGMKHGFYSVAGVEAAGATATYYGSRGVFAGGFTGWPSVSTIDYITIDTTGDAGDFGDLDSSTGFISENSPSNVNRGVFGGAHYRQDIIQYITFSTLGDATDFGDLTSARDECSGVSDGTLGVFGGGDYNTDVIDYITIATTGDATDFGDLTDARKSVAAVSSGTRGVFAGGQLDPSGPTTVNVMDYVTIMSAGNATDFGDLSKTPRNFTSLSDSHGGLGGF